MTRYTVSILLCVILVMNLAIIGDAARAKGKWRNRRPNRKGSPITIFYTHPRRKEYYDNPNGAQITKASHFDYEFLLGHKIVFICEAKGDPQPRINWFKDDIELYAHPFIKITEWQLKNKHIKSKLQITPARQMDSGMYECQANNKYSIDSRSFKADFSTISK
ncbi:immunoglobulin domain-containing protein oig-4-like isoform X2 [Centruroides sculpturatus]|uniref:immunoglobulin domain-containing protein oig-4-like isoform X2 n=1 Tax=Centruroides sculpturatus TaxID=218467 RepID=UPI000C6EF7B3|nr:immunoglobulin domain-containing protein oig-4-like isoform X2 [Centruroides sculpturatus]